MSIKGLAPLLVLILAFAFIGCEGPEGPAGAQGPQGPAGPQGPQGPNGEQYTYLGDNANACGMCHKETVEAWEATGHHEDAFNALVAIGEDTVAYCLQCHTTGWDDIVAYDGTVVTPGSDMTGYDDYFPPQNADDQARLDALKNVQCEACHGSLGDPSYHAAIVTFETQYDSVNMVAQSMCARCHYQVDEWYASGHGQVLANHGMTSMEEFRDEFNSASCAACHTGQGFASQYDATVAATPEDATLIGCPSCHDPHDNSIEYQLRTIDSETVMFDTLYTGDVIVDGYESGQLCMQCHHARRTNANVMAMIAGTYNPARFGPHGSPQMDAFIGYGAYEIPGYTYDRDHMHTAISEACVTCHMPTWGSGGSAYTGHDFEAKVEACAACHGTITDFDLNGLQTEVQDKIDQLLDLIGVPADSLGYPNLTTVEEREAGYAVAFLLNDGSLGAHNPAYALSLLDNAIDYLTTAANKQNGWAQK